MTGEKARNFHLRRTSCEELKMAADNEGIGLDGRV